MAKEAERLAETRIQKAREMKENALAMEREKKGKDELTEKTARELSKRLLDVDFKKNNMLNEVESNPFHPCTKGEAEMIRKTQLVQFGEDPCKLKKACESCVPRLKISGELKAKIEHLELKKQMRVDEIRILDRELVEKREEKRRFEEIRCSSEKESEGNEPKRQKICNDNFKIPKTS